MHGELQTLIEQQGLPHTFSSLVTTYYEPLAEKMAQAYAARGSSKTWLVGLQGTQGSGKSTTALFLKTILEQQHQLSTTILSIDDFYLTRAERLSLSKSIHPLLKTRGVPGTHDIELLQNTLEEMTALGANEFFRIPRFDKAIDDRKPKGDWDEIEGPVNIIILEGWCVGIGAQEQTELERPINELEAQEDQDGAWREYVNNQLSGIYKTLYDQLEHLVVLQAPSFSCVHEWRLLQENKLRDKLNASGNTANQQLMSAEEIARFISHYQRLTEQALTTLPEKADWVMYLGADHDITKLVTKDN